MYKRSGDNFTICDINANDVELIKELTGENYRSILKEEERKMLRYLKDGEVYVLDTGNFDTIKIRTRFYRNGDSTIDLPKEVFNALSLMFKHTNYGYVDTDVLSWYPIHQYDVNAWYPMHQYCMNDVNCINEIYSRRKHEIKKVIFNEPATIVFWGDGTKTVVKCSKDDEFDPEKGLAMAIAKKFFGNENGYSKNIKKWTDMYEKANISINTGARGIDNSATDVITNVVDSAYRNLEATLMRLIDNAIKNKFGEDEE